MQTLGERLKDLRKALNISRSDLGKKCGLNNPDIRIGSYETGKRYPKEEMINKLSNALNVSSDYLKTGIFDKKTLATFREEHLIGSLYEKKELATCFYQISQLLHANEDLIRESLDEEDYKKISRIIYNKVKKQKGTIDIMVAFMTEEEYQQYSMEKAENDQYLAERYEEERLEQEWEERGFF